MPKLIVALGNPGFNYSNTRHNIGWIIFDKHKEISSLLWKEKFKGLVAEMNLSGEKIFFLKPQTFMNLSGESVIEICNFYKIEIENILVVHDELDLPFGNIAFKNGGGSAGHNGLKSISEKLGKNEFKRLRIGIGRPTGPMPVASYVLSGFSKNEESYLSDLFELSGKAIFSFLIDGFEKASSNYSKKSVVNN